MNDNDPSRDRDVYGEGPDRNYGMGGATSAAVIYIAGFVTGCFVTWLLLRK